MRIISGLLRGRQLSFPADIRPTQNKVRKAVFDCLGQAVEGAEFLELFAGSGAVGIEAISCGAQRVTFVDSNFNSLKVIESNLKKLDLDVSRYRIVRGDVFKYLDDWEGKDTGFDIVFSDPPYMQLLGAKPEGYGAASNSRSHKESIRRTAKIAEKVIVEGDFLGANENIRRTAKIAEKVIVEGDFLAKNCLLRIAACDILNPSGILVIEHHKKEELPQEAVGNGRGRSLILFKQKSYGEKVLSFYEEVGLKNVPKSNLSRFI